MKRITSEPNEGFYPVNALKGHYVKRKAAAAATYKVVGYDHAEGMWQLDDANDISRCIYVKPGTMLYAGFTY